MNKLCSFVFFVVFVLLVPMIRAVPSSRATSEQEEKEYQRQLQATTPQPSISNTTMAAPAPSPAPVVITPSAPTLPTDGPPTEEPTDGGGFLTVVFELLANLFSLLLGLDKRGGDRPAGYVAPTGQFRLKLHWEEDYNWQNNPSEREYCMTCCRCEQLNFANNGADSSPFNCVTGDCEAGDQLWTRRCDEGYGDVFEVMDEGLPDGVLVRAVTNNNNVCLTRAQTRYITLEPCDATNQRQLFQFFTTEQPFELKPVYLPFYYFVPGGSYCITQPHHPKSQEMFGIKDCAA